MKLRLPHPFRRPSGAGPIPELGIVDPGPAFRIIEPPPEGESVRRVVRTPEMRAAAGTPTPEEGGSRTPPPPPLEAGYRWGMAAARMPCDLADPDVTAPPEAATVEVMPFGGHLPAVRFERAVLAVAARTEVLTSAVERLHERLMELDDRFVDVVTHGDLLEVESRRARLAAEVSRLSVELKAEMDRRLTELGRAVADPSRRTASIDHLGTMDLADAQRAGIHLRSA